MKKTHKLLCLVLVLFVFLSLALPAMASGIHPAYVSCSCTTTTKDSLLVSTVKIGYNPDSALLRITQQLQSGSYSYKPKSGNSERRAVCYTFDSVLSHLIDYPPNMAYICYEVCGGTTYPAYARYDTYRINQ